MRAITNEKLRRLYVLPYFIIFVLIIVTPLLETKHNKLEMEDK